MTSYSFSYCWRCSQRFFLQLQCEKLAFVPLPSKSLSFFINKKKKTCSTTQKGPHALRKFSFQKKQNKKKRKKTETWSTTSTSHSLQARQPALFSAAAAQEAREAALRAASRFSALLAAASRFCCSNHGNCSASRTKSQILQPRDPGLRSANGDWTVVTELTFLCRMGNKTSSTVNTRDERIAVSSAACASWKKKKTVQGISGACANTVIHFYFGADLISVILVQAFFT